MNIGVQPEVEVSGGNVLLSLKFYRINDSEAPVLLPGDPNIWGRYGLKSIDPEYTRSVLNQACGIAGYDAHNLLEGALSDSTNPYVAGASPSNCPDHDLILKQIGVNGFAPYHFLKETPKTLERYVYSGCSFLFGDPPLTKNDPYPGRSLTFPPYYGGGGIYPGFTGGLGGRSGGGGANGEWHPDDDEQWHPDPFWDFNPLFPGGSCVKTLVTDGGLNIYSGSPWSQVVHVSLLKFVAEANADYDIFDYGEPLEDGWRWTHLTSPQPWNVISPCYNEIRYAGHHIERNGEFPSEEFPITRTTTYQEHYYPAKIYALGECHSEIVPSEREEEPEFGPLPIRWPTLIIIEEDLRKRLVPGCFGFDFRPYDLMWHGKKLLFKGEQITYGDVLK